MTYIDPRGKLFAHLDLVVGWQQGQHPAPVTVEWDLSNRCVLGCQDCHFAHTHTKGPWKSRDRLLPMAYQDTGDLADMELVIKTCYDLGQAGVKSVVWSGGGEPTTHPDWMEAVFAAAHAGLKQGMYTLGGLFTRFSAKTLASYCDWIVVSLDCADPMTYAAEKGVPAERFTAAYNGIRWLVDAQSAVIGVSFLLHNENYTKAWDMLELSRSLGATYTTFRPAIRVSQLKPGISHDNRRWITSVPFMFDRLAQEKDVEIDVARFRAYAAWNGHGYTECQGPRLNTTITPDGRVWICPQRRGVTALGDLRTESFADIWARHPGHYTVDDGCRVMCRLHPINQELAAMAQSREHANFL